MTAITSDEARRPALEGALPFLVGVVAYAVMLAGGNQLLADPDTYWHIVVGAWMLDHGVPHADPFSFTFAGEPWIAKEWLSQLLYYAAWRLAGWTGVAVLAATAVAAALGLLTHALARRVTPIVAIAAAAIAFLLIAPHALARPHALALPVAVAWVAGIVRAADEGRAPSPWLLPLMVLWANLHGGFTFGIFLVGAAGLDAIVAAPPARRIAIAMRWIGFGLLALVAGCVTPYGPESLLVTVRILGLGPALAIIHEWQPADFSRFGGLEMALLAGLGFALWRGFTLPPVRILVVLGLIHMALSAERNAELLALVAPLFIAAPLARQAPDLAAPAAGRSARGTPALAAMALAVALALTVALAGWTTYRPARAVSPEGAVAALKAAGIERVMNAYDFGGYLVAEGLPTFIDGRTELYGGAFVARHIRAVTLADLDDFVASLDEFAIEATLLQPAAPAIALLDRLPGWRRLYADDIAVVHVRAADAE